MRGDDHVGNSDICRLHKPRTETCVRPKPGTFRYCESCQFEASDGEHDAAAEFGIHAA